MSQNIRFACFMPVGPGESRITLDTLDSLKHYYPNADPWILDDCTSDGTYEALQAWVEDNGGHLLRNDTPAGFHHLISGFCKAMRAILTSGVAYDFVCRIDTDVCFTGSGLDRVILERFTEHGPGAVGNYRFAADRTIRTWAHIGRKMWVDYLPVGIAKSKRRGSKLPVPRIGSPPYIAYFRNAREHGYQAGENVFGPCYAIHFHTLQEMDQAGFFQALQPPFRSLVFEDEILVCLGVRAVGHALIELDPPDRPPISRLHYYELPTLSPEDVIRQRIAVVHPLKQNNLEALRYRDALKALRE